MRRWIYVGLGICGMAVALVLHLQMPEIVPAIAFATIGIALTLIVGKYPWLLGLAMMILPLPMAIAQYPLSHQLTCQRIVDRPSLANCHIKLRHLSGWGDYRRDYTAIKRAKIIQVNAISSSERGGKQKRPEPITVQLYPLFLMDGQGKSRKLKEFEYTQSITTPAMNQINHFLAGNQPTFTINLLDDHSGSTSMSHVSYILFSLFQVLMFGLLGAAVILKSITG